MSIHIGIFIVMIKSFPKNKNDEEDDAIASYKRNSIVPLSFYAVVPTRSMAALNSLGMGTAFSLGLRLAHARISYPSATV